ncbi:MAG TPA: hypothetical protein EYN54_14170 [Methylococcaceae bacterium]|nr:hypothetical protein [Methylococcaceae bacterium]
MANSKRKCKNCNERVREYIVINNVAYCSFESAVQYANNNKAKGAEINRKSADKVHRDKKKTFRLSDTKLQHDLTQPVFNKLRVLQEKKWFTDRGLEPQCISCGKENMDWCCGHFKSRGAQGNLRYDEKNTYLQCNRYCNMALSGNIAGNKTTRGYAAGLLVRFGEASKDIIEYCESSTAVKKWTGEELQAMRKEFNLQIKELNNI